MVKITGHINILSALTREKEGYRMVLKGNLPGEKASRIPIPQKAGRIAPVAAKRDCPVSKAFSPRLKRICDIRER
jgi:hypothetical protein